MESNRTPLLGLFLLVGGCELVVDSSSLSAMVGDQASRLLALVRRRSPGRQTLAVMGYCACSLNSLPMILVVMLASTCLV